MWEILATTTAQASSVTSSDEFCFDEFIGTKLGGVNRTGL